MTDEDSTYQAALDREAEQRQMRVGGAANVQTLRALPGAIPPEAAGVALERLLEAMCLTSAVNRTAAEAYKIAFRVAAVSAPYGLQGPGVEKIIATLAKRLDAHLATLPNQLPPGAA